DEAVWLNSGFVEVDEVVGYQFRRMYKLPGGRLAGRLAHSWGKALDWGIGVGIDVGVQWWLDRGNPYLTAEQKAYRAGIAGVGGLVSGGVGALVKAGLVKIGLVSGPAGWVAVAVGIGFEVTVWDRWIAPMIYESGGLNEELRLLPLGGGAP
ncbi:MAG: hypothetical protein ACOYZ7_03055, partial [Chloroflexota bacterium]